MRIASLHPGKEVYEARIVMGGHSGWHNNVLVRVELIGLLVRANTLEDPKDVIKQAVEHILPPGLRVQMVVKA